MKNLKGFLVLLPLLVLAVFIYFSTNGFSSQPDSKTLLVNKENERTDTKKPSIVYPVHLTNIGGGGCLSGDYTYCIDHGRSMKASGDFEVDLACGQYHTICINSSTGCYGTWTGWIDCFATFPQINIDLSTTPVQCLCQ